MLERYADLDADLAVGSCPCSQDDVRFVREVLGAGAVVSLQTDDDLRGRGLQWSILWQLWLGQGVRTTRVPIADFDKRDLRRRLDDASAAVSAHVAAGRKVYVHCTAGLNRSPSTVLAYVMLARGLSLEAALAWLEERYEAVPYVAVLKKWARRRGLPVTG